MGLDITAYRNIAKVDLSPEEIDEDGCPKDWNSGIDRVSEAQLRMHDTDFPGRSEGVEPGYYRAEEVFGFRAGSYGGYNQWREWLSRLAGYPKGTDTRWGSSHSAGAWGAGSGPFYELIQFSDCEGIIGPVVAKKLAADFAAYADKVGAGYDADRFREWQKAFEMASENGYVDFH